MSLVVFLHYFLKKIDMKSDKLFFFIREGQICCEGKVCGTSSWSVKPSSKCSTFHLSDLVPAKEHSGASQVALVVKNLPANAGDVRDAGWIPG